MKLSTAHKIGRFFQYFVLILVGVIMIYPLVWMVGATFKSNAEIFAGIGFLTANPPLQGYIDAVTQNYGGDISIWRAFITVPLKLVFALFIAYILNFKIKFVNLFRTVYYIPSILGGSVAIAVLWRALFKDTGVVNTILGFFGIAGPDWLADKTWALFVICLLRVWQFGSAMVLFLAALKGVPADLYEAATIDGASKTKQFFSITVPMITPVIFYNLVTQIAQAFQEFNGPYIITQGGPRNATTLVSLLVYNYAFKSNEMGMACALAWVMFIAVALLTVIAFTSQKHWVYYAD